MNRRTRTAGVLWILALAVEGCLVLTDPDRGVIEEGAGAGGGGGEASGGSSGSAGTGAGEALEQPTLPQKYADYFAIGAAVDPQSYQTHAELLTVRFNSITTENAMKFESLQRTEGAFRFAAADAMVVRAEGLPAVV
jgi:hypothetical protein